MNAHITVTRAPASPTAPVIDWTHDPRAVALLASCVATPPEMHWQPSDWTRDGHYFYIGERAERLEAIRKEYAEAALAEGPEAFAAWAATPTVFDAIEAARDANDIADMTITLHRPTDAAADAVRNAIGRATIAAHAMRDTIKPRARRYGPLAATVAAFGLMIAAPLGFAAYAHSRPVSERVCTTARDYLVSGPNAGERVTVRTCRVLGVEVSRAVSLETLEG